MDEDSKLIPLTKGYSAIVDASDHAWLSQWEWYATPRKCQTYAVRDKVIDGKKVRFWMHRIIMGDPEGLDVDHRDGDGLNNRRKNLRKATRSQNLANQHVSKRGNRYRGIYLRMDDGKWIAEIKPNGKKYTLGSWNTEEEAARAYDAASLFLNREFASFNFPDSVLKISSINELRALAKARKL